MILNVRCTFVIPVEVPDEHVLNASPEEIRYLIEDHDCPATGNVGAALEDHVEKHAKAGTCWACALGATTEIVP